MNSVINEKNVNTSLDLGLSNIKCEFDEEEDVLENQLHEENVNNKFSLSITKLHDDEEGKIPGSFQKNQPTITDKFSQRDDKIEYVECKSDTIEEPNTSLDYELSNIKYEIDEEETKIQYGILDDPLHEENIAKYATDITTYQILNGASSQKNDPTIFELGLKREEEIQTDEKWSTENMNSHTGDNPFKCETCGQCFKRKAILISHRRIHTVENINKCEICDESFSQKHHLIKHMMMHTGEKPHQCETCSRSFGQKYQLNQHMRIHTGEKPYKCKICSKCFNKKDHLNQHNIRNHTGDKLHKCELCSKSFSENRSLNTHMMTHTGEKPHKCEICGKCFSVLQNLNKHMRTHTGEKPHKCEICGNCFTENGSLKKHMMIHTGEKPYKCEICGKCFSAKQNLDRHMRIHTGEKPYKCEICSKCFSQKNHLNQHMSIHKDHFKEHSYSKHANSRR